MPRRSPLLLAALACATALHAGVTLQTTTSPTEAGPSFTVTVTGSGFPSGTIPASQVQVTLNPATAGAGPSATVTANTVVLVVGVTRRVSFQIPANLIVTAPTAYQVSVSSSTLGFQSGTPSALTLDPPPVLVSATPASGSAGQSVSVSISAQWTLFVQGVTQASFGAGIGVGGGTLGATGPVSVTSPTTLTATLQIDAGAAVGARTITVQTGTIQAQLTNGFTVTQAPPPPSSVVTLAAQTIPAGAQEGSPVSISGTGFPAAAIDAAKTTVYLAPAVANGGPTTSVTPASVIPASGTSRTVQFTIPRMIPQIPLSYVISLAGAASDDTPFSSGNTAAFTLLPVLAVSPATATVYPGESRQFTANQNVTWSLAPPTGAGTLSGSGLYTAPATVAAQQTVTVTATSQTDQAVAAQATVTLMPAVTVSPAAVTLAGGGSQQFTANQNVTWSLGPPTGAGTISAAGLYIAPATIAAQQTVTVTATSAVDATQSATATVTLSACALSGYLYQRSIVINHNRVPNTDQGDFPLLINVTDPTLANIANGGHVTNASGYDIVFAADAAGISQLSHEIASYNPASGQFVAWVQIPSLSHSSDTTIYMLYGNPAITASQELPGEIWDVEYQAVWHLGNGNGTVLSAADSTDYGWNGTVHGATASAGAIAGAANFSGSGQYIGVGSIGAKPTQGTISMWVRAPALANSPNAFTTGPLDGAACGNEAIRLELTANGSFNAITGADNATCSANFSSLPITAAFTPNAWHYVAVTWDSSQNTETLYYDGSASQPFANSYWPTNFDGVAIGAGYDISRAWNGQIAEVRLSGSNLSADWIAAEYNNQNSPATFHTLGPESAQGVGITPPGAVLFASQTQQFAAAFTGGCANVTWNVSPGGTGTIDATGLYTAPAAISSWQTAIVTATAQGPIPAAATVTVTLAPPMPIGVAVSPSAAALSGGQTQQFSAAVSNTGNTAVTWSLSPSGVGTVDASGFYTAPAVISAQEAVMVTATSQVDNTKSASALVTLTPVPGATLTVGVSPSAATISAGQTQQFSATIAGSASTAVVWSLNPSGVGTINSTGLYSAPATSAAPQTVTVTATSQTDNTKWAAALVTVTPPAVSVSVSPSDAAISTGQQQQFTASVDNTTNTAVTWSLSPIGVGTIDSTGLYNAPSTLAAQQTITVTATSQADGSQSALALITITPPAVTVNLFPTSTTISAGQQQQFTATVTNTGNTAVAWSLNPPGVGAIDSTGLYTAPSTLAAQQTIAVTATSLADSTQTALALITVQPPVPPIASVAPGTAPVGVTQTVTITGNSTRFVQGQTQVSFGTSVAVSNVVVLSPTQVTASILPSFTAAPGLVGVTVTTDGSSVSLANALTITGPLITITSPENLSFVNTPTITVSGQVGDPTAVVAVNGVEAANVNGSFSSGVPLSEGNNTVAVTARSAGWATSVAIIQVNLDTTPPHVAIVSPPTGTQTAETSITVAGMVNDIVVGTVNSQQAQVTVNAIAATVSNRSFSAVVPLSMGQNTIQAAAIDRVGNTATTSVTVTRVATSPVHIVSGNNQTGTVQNPLPLPLVVQIFDRSGLPAPNQPVVFAVAKNNGIVSAVAASGVGQASVQVTSDANGRAQVYWTLGSHAGAGNNRVDVTSPGNSGWVYFTAIGLPTAPAAIVVDSGLNQTGATGEVLPLPFIAVVVDAGKNRLAGVPVTFTVTGGGGTLSGTASQLNSAAAAILSSARDGRPLRTAPGKPKDSADASNSVTMVTDGDGRAAAFLQLGTVEGRGNEVVTATFAGNPGSPAVFMASGLVAGNPAQTTVTGVVLDNSNVPIPGVSMRLLALSQGTGGNVPVQVAPTVLTDSQGQFTITQAPVGVFKLMADGTTVIAAKKYPTLEFDVTTVAGRATTVGMPIYLQSLDTVNQICVGPTTGGTLTLPAAPGFSLTVAPGSATFPGGNLYGCITATPVNPDKVPMAPGFGQQPRFIVTIQPVGTTFNPPAALTLPNVEGLAPRAITEMYSYDHDLAAFVAIGTGTVSADGSLIVSDPGVGVLKAGWHCGGNPCPPGTVCSPLTCFICSGNPPTPVFNDGASCDPHQVCWVGKCRSGLCQGLPGPDNQRCTNVMGGPGCCQGGYCSALSTTAVGVDGFNYVESIIAPTSNNWGETQPTTLNLNVTAYFDQASNSWKAKLSQADQHYTIWYHLVPGVSEASVASATQDNYCEMVTALINLGYGPDGAPAKWYMVEAVEAHERQHVKEIKQSEDPQWPAMKAAIENLSVPFDCTLDAAGAAAQIKRLWGFTAAKLAAENAFTAVFNAIPDPNANTNAAECAAVNPVIAGIKQKAADQHWKACKQPLTMCTQ